MTHIGAIGVAAHLDTAIHVVAVQRVKTQAAARGRQLADLGQHIVHSFLSASRWANHAGSTAIYGVQG